MSEIFFKGASVNVFEVSVQESYETRIIRESINRTSFPNKKHYFKTGKNITLFKRCNREKLEKAVDCLGHAIDEEESRPGMQIKIISFSE